MSAKVFVAVGHGRRSNGTMDPGATDGQGRSEQSEGQPICEAMVATLRAAGVQVRFVERGGPDFAGAARQANSWGADLAVEVHHDWIRAPRGAFGFWASAAGKRLADAMLRRVRNDLNYPTRMSWHRARPGLGWLRITRMPAVLWECDRIGSVPDHRAYGEALARGVLDYLGVSAPPPGRPAPSPSPSPSPPPSGGSRSAGDSGLLRRGSRGAAVRRWQQDLQSWNADALPRWGADGDFGPETENWTRRFQRSAGIAVDGIVGPQSRGAMGRALSGGSSAPSPAPTPAPSPAPSPPRSSSRSAGDSGLLRRGSRGAPVRRWQQDLQDWNGSALPRWGADGDFGPETEDWTRRFQRAAGIGVDGIVGPQSRGAMRRALT